MTAAPSTGRGRPVAIALLAVTAAVGSSFVARAARADEPWRMALVVGNNVGSGARPALRYAEEDATRFARVLVELGGFEETDVRVLTGQPLSSVLLALLELRDKVLSARSSGRRAVVLFYFSGHSDGQALELGREAWQFRELRRALAGLGAEIRLAVVDSCRSGALLTGKGGVPGPSFDIRFTDDLATSGEAVLTSAAADELALESREIRGSIFTHHLLSGLRGAADTSGDGRVTLTEGYRYAFVNTLLATSGTLTGPQHPAYDYSMSGRGELVLTQVGARGATLSLPPGYERILVADGERRVLMAELTGRSARRIALPPGRYYVVARRRGRGYEAHLSLADGQSRALAASELTDAGATIGASKGGDVAGGLLPEVQHPGPAPRAVVAIAGGVLPGASRDTPFLRGLRFGLRGGQAAGGALLELELGSGRGPQHRESAARAGLGLFMAGRLAGVRLQLAGRLVGALAAQTPSRGETHTGWILGAGPTISASVPLGGGLALLVSAGAEALWLRRDGQQVVAIGPSAFAGLEWSAY